MRKYNLVRKSEYADDSTSPAGMVAFPITIVPTVLRTLALKSAVYFWATSTDWVRARHTLNALGADMLRNPMREMTNRQDQLYVMHRAVFAGVFTVASGAGTSADPFTYDPPLRQSFETEWLYDNNAQNSAGNMLTYLNNISGDTRNVSDAIYDVWFGNHDFGFERTQWDQIEDINTKLQALLDAGNGSEAELEALGKIIALLGAL